jgi:hypothetical protein
MPVCTQCGQENPDIAKFCLACGAPLAAPAPPAEERKLITVLFCDIVGSTAKAEHMDPEDVRARLGPYYTRLRSELERFGGPSRSSSGMPPSPLSELRLRRKTTRNARSEPDLRSARRSPI